MIILHPLFPILFSSSYCIDYLNNYCVTENEISKIVPPISGEYLDSEPSYLIVLYVTDLQTQLIEMLRFCMKVFIFVLI